MQQDPQSAQLRADQQQEIARLTSLVERVTNDWAELDALNGELQEKLALQETRLRDFARNDIDIAHRIADMEETLASREESIEKYASQYLAAAREASALKLQLDTLQQEAHGVQLARLRQRETDERAMSAMFAALLETFDHVERDNQQVISTAQRLEADPQAHETAQAVRQTLARLLHDWEAEMRETPARLEEFKTTWLDSLDAQIAELKLHKKALQLLDDLDKESWHEAILGRRALIGAQARLTSESECALQAVRMARLLHDGPARPEAAFASIELAYRLVRVARHTECYDLEAFGASDVNIDIGRTVTAVQAKINSLVASGTRYVVTRGDTPPRQNLGWELVIPEPRVATAYVDAGDERAPVPIRQRGRSYEPDPYSVNPANGMPMHGGIGGLDVFGNAYGTNLNDPW